MNFKKRNLISIILVVIVLFFILNAPGPQEESISARMLNPFNWHIDNCGVNDFTIEPQCCTGVGLAAEPKDISSIPILDFLDAQIGYECVESPGGLCIGFVSDMFNTSCANSVYIVMGLFAAILLLFFVLK